MSARKSQEKQQDSLTVKAIVDALKALKSKDLPTTHRIIKKLEALPVMWNLNTNDSSLLGHFHDGGMITLNQQAMKKMSPTKRASLLLHEMIHSIGGTELDAEAFERWVFPKVNAIPPSYQVLTLFRTDGGEFVRWELDSGNVYLKRNGKLMCRL